MASTTQEEVKISIITRSGAGEETQSAVETVQDKDIEVKEEPITRQATVPSYNPGRSMALGGYIASTIDWTQDLQLPDRLEDFKHECLTLFGLELKEATIMQRHSELSNGQVNLGKDNLKHGTSRPKT